MSCAGEYMTRGQIVAAVFATLTAATALLYAIRTVNAWRADEIWIERWLRARPFTRASEPVRYWLLMGVNVAGTLVLLGICALFLKQL